MLAQLIPIVAQTAQPSPLMNMVPMALILVVFYFLLIAPMRKRQKALQTQVDAMQKGDSVVTSGGLHGKVVGFDEAVAIVEIADKVKVRVSKSAINSVQGKEDGKGATK